MSDFLTHLAARSLDLPAAVQPRPASLFEPQRPLDGTLGEPRFQEAEETIAAAAVASHPRPFSRPVPSSGREALQPPEDADLSGASPADGSSARPPLAPVTAVSPPPVAPAAPLPPLPEDGGRPPRRSEPARTGIAAAVPHRPEPAPAAERVSTIRIDRVMPAPEVRPLASSVHPAPPPVLSPARPGRETAAGIERVIVEREVAALPPPSAGGTAGPHDLSGPLATALQPAPPSVDRVIVEREAAATVFVSRPEPIVAAQPFSGLLVPRSEPAFPAVPPPLSTGGGAAPTIEVTIGRIEVRATPASAASSPARRRAAGPPAMSLQDYLRQRDGRGGGR